MAPAGAHAALAALAAARAPEGLIRPDEEMIGIVFYNPISGPNRGTTVSERTVTIDLEDLEMAMQDQGTEWCIDPVTGAACMDADEAAMICGEDVVESMTATDPEDVLEVPPFDSSDGYRMMEAFAESLDEAEVARTLLDALDRPKPFRRFKDALAEFPATREAWFAYRAEQIKRLAEDYYADQGIRVEWK